jgi:hypothetical protein
MKYLLARPERRTQLSDLASSLDEVKPSVTEAQLKLSDTTERKDRQKEDAVDIVTKSLSALILSLTAAVTRMEAAATMMTSARPMDKPDSGLDPALDRRQGQSFRPFTCFFCDEPGHVKPKCPHFNRLLRENSIHVNGENKICLGPFREEAMPIWKIPGMSMLQTVERQVNMKGASASAEMDCITADLEEDSDVEVAQDSPKDATMDVEENIPNAAPAKATKIRKTSLKKLLAGHADPMSVIDRMLQQPLTISWAEALSLSGDLRKFMFGMFDDPKANADQAVNAQSAKWEQT